MKLRSVSTAVVAAIVATLVPLGITPAGASDHGPKITKVALVADGGAYNRWQDVGDVIRIRWSERATHAGGDRIDQAELRKLLGQDVDFAVTSRVVQGGDGTRNWTLRIAGTALDRGIAVGQSVNGTAGNTNVRDNDDGNPQRKATGERLLDRVRPFITSTRLTTDTGGDAQWKGVGDVITVRWSEAVSHVGDSSLVETEVERVLGTGIAFGGASTVVQGGDGTSTWSLRVAGAALSEGVSAGNSTNGTGNSNVTDAAGNAQRTTSGEALGIGPRITKTYLTHDGGTLDNWGAVGDILTVDWSEGATQSGDTSLSQSELRAALGVSGLSFGTGTTVTQTGDGTNRWRLTIGSANLATGIAGGVATNGSSNSLVTDSAGNPQVASAGKTLGVGPRLQASGLTTDVGTLDSWDAVGDVLTLDWSEAAIRTGGDATLSAAQVAAILGVTPTYAGLSTVTLAGSGNDAWTLTIGGADLAGPLTVNTATPGTDHTAVRDTASNPQLSTSGVVIDAGPRISTTSITVDTDFDDNWDADGDVLVVRFNEDATHIDNDGSLNADQLNDLLGPDIDIDLGPGAVDFTDNGTDVWTLTIDDADLTTGLSAGDDTPGTDNADVTDGTGNDQRGDSTAVLDIGPKIEQTSLSIDAGGTSNQWDAVGDQISIKWTEAATHTGDTSIDETELEAILGTAMPAFAGTTVVTQGGDGTDRWTLTVGTAALTTGLALNASTPGTNNPAVTDDPSGGFADSQLPTTGEQLGIGPKLVDAALTVDTGTVSSWNAVGDEITLTFNKAATHTGNQNLDQAEVQALLGNNTLAFGATTNVLQGGDGTTEWTLTIQNDPLSPAVAVGAAVNGSANPNVTDSSLNPQVVSSGILLGDAAGPTLTEVAVRQDASGNDIWSAVSDELVVRWTEAATHPDTSLTQSELNAILGTSITYTGGGTPTTVTISNSTNGTANWRLQIGGSGFVSGGLTSTSQMSGTNNSLVLDSSGNGQVITPAPLTRGSGPRLVSTYLSTDTGTPDSEWESVNDVLTIDWSEAASHSVGDGNNLTQAQVRTLLGDTAVTYGALTEVGLDYVGGTTSSAQWTLTIAEEGLSSTIEADSPLTIGEDTNGTNDGSDATIDVTDATTTPQVLTSGLKFDGGTGVRPYITQTSVSSDGGTQGFWEAIGDVLRIQWNEKVDHTVADGGSLSLAQANALLGTTLTSAGTPTFVLDSDPDEDTWTLTIADTALTGGLDADVSITNGSSNGDVTDKASKTQQVAPSTVTVGQGPRITTAVLSTDNGTAGSWNAIGDVITLTWDEAADNTATLNQANVRAILGDNTLVFAGSTTVTLGGDASTTWTLTIGGAAMTTGFTTGSATNGSDNANVTDSGAHPQVESSGVTLSDTSGPKVLDAELRKDFRVGTPTRTWDAVGDELRITWSESATRHDTNGDPLGDDDISEAEVSAMLGRTVDFGDTTTVALTGTGSTQWTLTIAGELLDTGVAVGQAVEGQTNNRVRDANGNVQGTAAGEVLLDKANPFITSTGLTTETGTPDTDWDEVGDVLTVRWTEAVNHAGDTMIDQAEIRAVLGDSTIEASPLSITQGGDGTDVWTFTIGTAPLTTGLAGNADTDGQVNTSVTDTASPTNAEIANPTTAGVDVTFGKGPKLSKVELTTDNGNLNRWNAVGDVIRITWDEAATHSEGNATWTGSTADAEVTDILGLSAANLVANTGTTVTLAGSGTQVWTLTIGAQPMSSGLESISTVSTNGKLHLEVTDVDGNNELPTTGKTLNVGPRIGAASLPDPDVGSDDTWDDAGDIMTLSWSETAVHTAGNTTLSQAQVRAILGDDSVTYVDGTTTVTLAGSNSATWTLEIGGAGLSDGVAENDDVNGSDNADVTDTAGAPQVRSATTVDLN